jgi:polyferredoxin
VTIDVCSRVVVVIAREIGDIEYSTNMGAITIPTPFESPVRSCSLTYYFSVEEVQGQPFDTAIFSFESSSGTTTFETANRNYIGFTFKVTL